MALTDTAIKKLKLGEKPVKVSDERGLYLLINPTGSKLWRWKYRFDGEEKVMPIGQYPDVSLAQARDAREDARKLLATGADPIGPAQGTEGRPPTLRRELFCGGSCALVRGLESCTQR